MALSDNLIEIFKKSFSEVYTKVCGAEILECSEHIIKEGPMYIVDFSFLTLVGITGKQKGQIAVRVPKESASFICEKMSFEPVCEIDEMCYCLSEFCNIFSGNFITYINNNFNNSLKLTPPAVAYGEKIEISVPNTFEYHLAVKDNSSNFLYIDIYMEGADSIV